MTRPVPQSTGSAGARGPLAGLPLRERLVAGVVAGALCAAMFTALAVVLLGMRGCAAALGYLPRVAGLYAAAGLAGGAAYGALAPAARTVPGAALVGALVGTTVYGAVAVLLGPSAPWRELLFISAGPGVTGGATAGAYLRWQARRAGPRSGGRHAA